MKKTVLMITAAAAISQFFASCKKDDNDIPTYNVPTTYNFDNVEYAEASGRIAMWTGFTAWLGKATGRRLTADSANYLWNNTNTAYNAEIASNLSLTPAQINALGYNLSGKAAEPAFIKAFVDSLVNVSQYYNTSASAGIPGKNGSRLFSYSGLEFNQAVAKGLMGSLQLTQIFAYLDKVAADDNNNVVTGSGTAMQHDWDMAFGYLGIPKDYDTAKSYASTDATRPLALGGYLKERGQFLKAPAIVRDAFIKGRAAINAKDYAGRDQAIVTIKDYLERTLAAACYAYVTLPQGTPTLDVKFHALSEGYGFMVALKFRPANSKLTPANYQTLQSIMQTNFYELAADASNTKLKQAQSILTAAYGQLQ